MPLRTQIVGHRPFFLSAWRFCIFKPPSLRVLSRQIYLYNEAVFRLMQDVRILDVPVSTIPMGHVTLLKKREVLILCQRPTTHYYMHAMTSHRLMSACVCVCVMGGRTSMGIKHCERGQATLTHLEKNRARPSLPTVVLEKR